MSKQPTHADHIARAVEPTGYANYLDPAFIKAELIKTDAQAHASRVKAAAAHPYHVKARVHAAGVSIQSPGASAHTIAEATRVADAKVATAVAEVDSAKAVAAAAEAKHKEQVRLLEASISTLQGQVRDIKAEFLYFQSEQSKSDAETSTLKADRSLLAEAVATLKNSSPSEAFQKKIDSVKSAVDVAIRNLSANDQRELSQSLAQVANIAGMIMGSAHPEVSFVVGEILNMLASLLTSGLRGQTPASVDPPVYQEADAQRALQAQALDETAVAAQKEQEELIKKEAKAKARELGWLEKYKQKQLEKKAKKAREAADAKELLIKNHEDVLKTKEQEANVLAEKVQKKKAELDAKAVAKMALRKTKSEAKALKKQNRNSKSYGSDADSGSAFGSALSLTGSTHSSATNSVAETLEQAIDDYETQGSPVMSIPSSRPGTPRLN